MLDFAQKSMEIMMGVFNTKWIKTYGLLIFSSVWLIFYVCNIDYQNHDDIYFALQAKIIDGNILDLVSKTAHDQGRVQAYVNMPIIFFLYKFYGTFWFKLINSLTILGVIFSIFFYLSDYRNKIETGIVFSLTLLVYPLHYYFMNFQGYPIIFNLGIIAAFISPQIVCKAEKIRFKIIGWAIFAFGLLGPEYMVAIGTLLMVLKIKSTAMNISKKIPEFSLALTIFSIYLGAYLIYKSDMQIVNIDNGRTQVEFSLLSIFSTFEVLFKNAFLLLGLVDGIPVRIGSGSLNKYINIDYFYLLKSMSYLYIALVFLISFIIVLAVLKLGMRYCNTKINIKYIFAVIFISCLPCLILSLSSNYQKLASANVLLGHPASLFLVLGLTYAVILIILRVGSLIDSLHIIKYIPSLIISAVLAITFLYNSLNRNLMHDNLIKWSVISSYTRALKSELCVSPQIIEFDQLWQSYGVSDIPDDIQYTKSNYWTEYLRYDLGFSDLRVSKNLNSENAISARYSCNGEHCRISLVEGGKSLSMYECSFKI
jgi:hypothetical protein